MQGSARKDVAFGPAPMYTVAVPGPKRKSWIRAILREREQDLPRGIEIVAWLNAPDRVTLRHFHSGIRRRLTLYEVGSAGQTENVVLLVNYSIGEIP